MSAPFIVQGSIALGSRPEWVPGAAFGASLDRSPGAASFVRPGLALRWDPARARCAASDEAVCIVLGRPRWIGGREPLDAAALVDALDQGGAAVCARLDGAFAVVAVSRRNARVLLAVDRFSMETLCFAIEGGVLKVADRADAVPVARRRVAWQSVFDYAYFHTVPAPCTIFDEVARLAHGTLLEVQGDTRSVQAYWQPRFAGKRTPALPARGRALRSALEAAVAADMSGESVGCFLSGGTDSSTVAGMVGVASGAAARTYSIGFDEPGYDEMEYARIAARHFGTSHHEYYVTADDVLTAVPQLAASLDQPFGNSSMVPAYFCARMAAADGVTRMLAGDGGDELFGGNTRYRLQHALDLYRHVPGAVQRALAPLAARLAGRTRLPGVRQVAGYVRAASVPMPDRLEGHNLVMRVGRERIFTPELLREVDAQRPLAQQRATYASAPAADIIDRMLFYDWKYTLADTDLPKVRGAVALAGITVGYPLLAMPIVTEALGLPPGYKVRGTRLRWFFKHALRGFLPPATLRKKKHGFGMPFGIWATRHAGLSHLASDSLATLERDGILRQGFRDELMRALLPSHPGYYGELVYILMMLGQWLATDAHARGATDVPPAGRDAAA